MLCHQSLVSLYLLSRSKIYLLYIKKQKTKKKTMRLKKNNYHSSRELGEGGH
jgi:hypothetical protein